MSDLEPKLDLKGQLYKQIEKEFHSKDGQLLFIPKLNPTFFSDNFETLPRPAQLEELGIDSITGSKHHFSPLLNSFSGLYEGYITEGFELVDKSNEEINAYHFKRIEQRKKMDQGTLKLTDFLEELRDEFDDLEEEEQKKGPGKKLTRKIQSYKKKLRDIEADNITLNSTDQDPELERQARAIKKFNIAKKEYNIEEKAGEQKSFDMDVYQDVTTNPANFVKMLKIDEEGKNESDQYQNFTTSMTSIAKSASESATAWNAKLDISYKIFSASGSIESEKTCSLSEQSLKNIELSMKITSIQVSRKWFDIQLFRNKRCTHKGYQAGQWSSVECPYIIEEVVVAKDLKMSGIEMSSQQKEESKKFSAKAKIEIKGFGGAGGGYKSNSASNSSKFDAETGTYTCAAPHCIGYLCRPFPSFPQVDSKFNQSQDVQTIKKKTQANRQFGELKNVVHIDQKKTSYCVRAAIATAATSQVAAITNDEVILDQKSLYGVLIANNQVKYSDNATDLRDQLKSIESGTDPKNFNLTYPVAFDIESTPYRLKLLIRELKGEDVPQDTENGFFYLIGYDINTYEGKPDPTQKRMHCIAVDYIKNGVITGFNSWGSVDAKPSMKITDPEVCIWQLVIPEVKEVDVCLPEEDRKDMVAKHFSQKTIALFDQTRETGFWCDLLGGAQNLEKKIPIEESKADFKTGKQQVNFSQQQSISISQETRETQNYSSDKFLMLDILIEDVFDTIAHEQNLPGEKYCEIQKKVMDEYYASIEKDIGELSMNKEEIKSELEKILKTVHPTQSPIGQQNQNKPQMGCLFSNVKENAQSQGQSQQTVQFQQAVQIQSTYSSPDQNNKKEMLQQINSQFIKLFSKINQSILNDDDEETWNTLKGEVDAMMKAFEAIFDINDKNCIEFVQNLQFQGSLIQDRRGDLTKRTTKRVCADICSRLCQIQHRE